MSVVSAKLIHDGRDGENQITKQKSIRRYTQTWRVITSDPFDDALVVEAACPQPGMVYPSDPYAWCQQVRSRGDSKSKIIWLVTCSYSTEREIQKNPLDDPAVIEWSSETFQRAFFKDRDGNWITNSVGDYFIHPLMGDDGRWTASITKNLPAVPAWLLQYRTAINSDTFVIDGIAVAPYQAKTSNIKIGWWQRRNGVRFRTLSLQMHLDFDEGWDKEVGDFGLLQKPRASYRFAIAGTAPAIGDMYSQVGSGTYQVVNKVTKTGTVYITIVTAAGEDCEPSFSGTFTKVTGSGPTTVDYGFLTTKAASTKRSPCFDDHGVAVRSPVPLDGYGHQLINPSPTTCVGIACKLYQLRPFKILPLT